jgi:hypothetical protein
MSCISCFPVVCTNCGSIFNAAKNILKIVITAQPEDFRERPVRRARTPATAEARPFMAESSHIHGLGACFSIQAPIAAAASP